MKGEEFGYAWVRFWDSGHFGRTYFCVRVEVGTWGPRFFPIFFFYQILTVKQERGTWYTKVLLWKRYSIQYTDIVLYITVYA